ncbi:DUF29 domain-containing protein [Geminicoccus harenae]|uniref:DUF29 domain-containing protein n=1 Tax=Geminicoccus harenae TaxID=2498453 RepID=UPI00168B7CCC|nr:DUF29 domain-containing protein [Geminicoccus harenae]
MPSEIEQLYETDFYAWTRVQAKELRRLARARWNGPLDLKHLAIEVADMGSEVLHGMESQLERIIEHLLKLQYSPAREPRADWEDTVDQARTEILRRLSPSTERKLRRDLDRRWQAGRRRAARALARHGEQDAAAAMPQACPYRFEQLLELDWYPPPAA